ncbi:FixH family protein [Deltaproteobacteria bacterium TL4]
MKISVRMACFIAVILWGTAPVWGQAQPQALVKNGYQLEKVTLNPNPPAQGSQTVRFELSNAQKQKVQDASVEVELYMPPMPGMAAISVKSTAKHLGNGRYEAAFEIPFGGGWSLLLRVKRASDKSVTEFPLSITIGTRDFTFPHGTH